MIFFFSPVKAEKQNQCTLVTKDFKSFPSFVFVEEENCRYWLKDRILDVSTKFYHEVIWSYTHNLSFVTTEYEDSSYYNFLLRSISAQHLLCVLMQVQVREWAITEQVWDTNLATVYLISHYSPVILLWCVFKNIQLLFAGKLFPHAK